MQTTTSVNFLSYPTFFYNSSNITICLAPMSYEQWRVAVLLFFCATIIHSFRFFSLFPFLYIYFFEWCIQETTEKIKIIKNKCAPRISFVFSFFVLFYCLHLVAALRRKRRPTRFCFQKKFHSSFRCLWIHEIDSDGI